MWAKRKANATAVRDIPLSRELSFQGLAGHQPHILLKANNKPFVECEYKEMTPCYLSVTFNRIIQHVSISNIFHLST